MVRRNLNDLLSFVTVAREGSFTRAAALLGVTQSALSQAISGLEARLDEVRSAPADAGSVRLVVRRPDLGVREILEVGELTTADGMVGDTWLGRSRSRARARC